MYSTDPAVIDPSWSSIITMWSRSLRAENKSENTIRIYTLAVHQLGAWLRRQELHAEPDGVTVVQLRDFLVSVLERSTPGNAHTVYRSLRTFFGWLVAEEERDDNPMLKVNAPHVPEQPVPIVRDDLVQHLLDQCSGRDYISRRDCAIVRLLIDTGGRLSEVGNLLLADVDLEYDVINVLGKGRRRRAIPFGAKTGKALAAYLRIRSKQPQADLPRLWLADRNRGALSSSGIKVMLRRRGARLGLTSNLHAHQFRHTLAHQWQVEGGNETDLMRIMGWRSPEMLRRYGASAATERAHKSHRNLRLGDRY